MSVKKGARVRIVKGQKGHGVAGAVFWKGPNKWGEGERLGVRGDDGETYWVADSDVEPTTDAAPPLEAGPTFEKGARVGFKVNGREGTGTVFWTGQSRQGPGQRLGVRDDAPEGEDDAVWLDSRQAHALEAEVVTAHPSPSLSHDEEEDFSPLVPSLDMPAMDDGPPIDDSWIDQQAAEE